MNFTKKEWSIWCLSLVLISIALGMSYLSAQTSDATQPTATIAGFNAAGYEATPLPVHRHHRKMPTAKHLPLELTPQGKPVTGETPTITMVPVGTTAAPTPYAP